MQPHLPSSPAAAEGAARWKALGPLSLCEHSRIPRGPSTSRHFRFLFILLSPSLQHFSLEFPSSFFLLLSSFSFTATSIVIITATTTTTTMTVVVELNFLQATIMESFPGLLGRSFSRRTSTNSACPSQRTRGTLQHGACQSFLSHLGRSSTPGLRTKNGSFHFYFSPFFFCFLHSKDSFISRADSDWKSLVTSLSGLFCASLNYIDETVTTSPQLTFVPSDTNKSLAFRYGALPKETVCTENLTPWTKILPCQHRVCGSNLL